MGKVANWFFGGIPENLEERAAGSNGSAGGDSPLIGVVPPSRYGTDRNISADQAMTLVPVFRAVTLLAGSVSQLSLGVWRNGEELPISSVNKNAIVARPSFDDSLPAVLEQTTVSLATSGNAYWRLKGVDTPADSAAAVEVLNPHFMAVDYDEQGNKVYRYSGYSGGERTFKAWQVKHLKYLRVPGSEYGLGPIQAAQAELRGSMDLRDYANNTFGTDASPSGVLKTDQTITADQASEVRTRYETQMNGKRGMLVLGSGLSYSPVYLNPVDAQFLENQKFNKTQIATLFGIPAAKLLADAGNSPLTYQNMETANTDYVRDTLMSYVKEIEEAFTLLIPRGQTVRFKVEELQRGDTNTRYGYYKTALEAGFMTVNEVRAKEGLPPMPGGDAVTTTQEVGDNGDSATSALDGN